jgi:Domain of unknown function (DUF4832)/Domain of unknown function (DUF4874)
MRLSRMNTGPTVDTRVLGARSPIKAVTAAVIALAVTLPTLTLTGRPADAADTVTTTYPRLTGAIANPERGFYRQQQECQGADFNPTTLQAYRAANFTLLMCIFYLPPDRDDINAEIKKFNTQVKIVRDNGMKMILRFAYAKTSHDAPVARVQTHLDQLTTPLRAAAKVIFTMQSGFVGAYGEAAASDHFGTEGQYTTQNIADREMVITRLLDILPNSRMVLVRTPRMKRLFFGDGHSTTAAGRGTRTYADRVGHHWDCYLANSTDGGTWTNGGAESIPTQKAWVAADTNFGALGGETCLFNDGDTPRLGCAPNAAGETVLTEMDRLNFTFLNNDWDPEVNNTWTTACRAEMDQKLGYRISIDSVTMPTSMTRGVAADVRLDFANTGWARPVNSRPVHLVFRNTSTGAVFRVSTGANASTIAGGGTLAVRKHAFTLPTTMPAGTYRVLLSLPDPLISTPATQGAYSIRLASTTGWDPVTGYNDLQRTVTVL